MVRTCIGAHCERAWYYAPAIHPRPPNKDQTRLAYGFPRAYLGLAFGGGLMAGVKMIYEDWFTVEPLEGLLLGLSKVLVCMAGRGHSKVSVAFTDQPRLVVCT